VATAIANAESRSELAASEARARELAEEQAALRRVATLVAEGASEPELFSAVAREVATVLGLDMVTIDRYNADASSTVVASLEDPAFPVGSRWPLDGPSVAATVLRTARPARIDDYTGLEGTSAAAMREQSARSAVGVPILAYGRVWGVICVGTTDTSTLPEGTEARLADFTKLLATAITNAESRAELTASEARAHDLAREQASLRRVATLVAENASAEKLLSAVAEEVAGVLAAPSVTIDRFDQDGSAATVVARWSAEGQVVWPVGSRWPLDGPSVAERVWKTGRPAMIDDYTKLPGSTAAVLRDRTTARAVGVPIVVGNRLWGIICAGTTEDDVLEALDSRLARFTELVATAIANSENRAELSASEARARELANEQAALRRVATLVARGVRPSEIFSAVSEEVGRLFGSEAAIARFEPDGSAMVVLGLTAGIPVVSIGDRWEHQEFLASTAVYRTGRPARYDHKDLQRASGPIADRLRELGVVSTVAAPIVVDGNRWGVITATDVHRALPPDAEERLERFTELVATALANSQAQDEVT
jgi:GAF domain-containing protein